MQNISPIDLLALVLMLSSGLLYWVGYSVLINGGLKLDRSRIISVSMALSVALLNWAEVVFVRD